MSGGLSFALLYESCNCSPAYGPKLAGIVETEAEAQEWASQSPSLFVRRFYEPTERLTIKIGEKHGTTVDERAAD